LPNHDASRLNSAIDRAAPTCQPSDRRFLRDQQGTGWRTARAREAGLPVRAHDPV